MESESAGRRCLEEYERRAAGIFKAEQAEIDRLRAGRELQSLTVFIPFFEQTLQRVREQLNDLADETVRDCGLQREESGLLKMAIRSRRYELLMDFINHNTTYRG